MCVCPSLSLLCVYVCVKASAAFKVGTRLGLVCLADSLALKKKLEWGLAFFSLNRHLFKQGLAFFNLNMDLLVCLFFSFSFFNGD